MECFECSSDTSKACATLEFEEDDELPLKLCAEDVIMCFTKTQSNITKLKIHQVNYAFSNIKYFLINSLSLCLSIKYDLLCQLTLSVKISTFCSNFLFKIRWKHNKRLHAKK